MWIFLWLVMIGVEVAGEWIEEKWNGDGIQICMKFVWFIIKQLINFCLRNKISRLQHFDSQPRLCGNDKNDDPEDPAALVGSFKRYKN